MVGELWDLRAVVEGFSRSRTMPETFFSAPNSPAEAQENEDRLFSLKAEAASRELEEFVKPFFLQPSSEQNKHEEKKPSSPAPKLTKRRKNPPKKVVCELPADALSDNVWAWRKYGQKPIKDSPNPRAYYRCSSSKGCPARKQVERSRTKPGYFVVVYTGEHNHAAPIHRQRSPPLLGLPKIPTFTQISAQFAGDGGSAATSPATPSASAVEPQIPPVMKEKERETGGTLLGDELDKLSDDDFIFMDLDLLIDSDADGAAAAFADDIFSDDGDVWPPRIPGS